MQKRKDQVLENAGKRRKGRQPYPEQFEEVTLGSLRKAVQDGNLDEGSFLCGAIAGMVKEVKPCKDIIEEMFGEAEALLSK